MFNYELCKSTVKARGMRNYQLAKDVGITENYICKVLNGKVNPSINLVHKLAYFLSINANELDDRIPEGSVVAVELPKEEANSTGVKEHEVSEISQAELDDAVDRLSESSSVEDISNQYVLDALNVLKYTCDKFVEDSCNKCPLKRRDGVCGVTGTQPCNYNTVRSTHWTAFRV